MNRKSLPAFLLIAAVALVAPGEPAVTAGDKPKPDPLVVIPDAKDIAEIRVMGSEIFPSGPYDPKKKFDLKLSKDEQFRPVLEWLKAIDWDRSKAEDITELRKVARFVIVGEIVITKKDKGTQRFELQTDFVMVGNYRWKADAKKLDANIKKLR
jgi:hypothetical protein